MAINTSFLGHRKLYQFNKDGPVFTPEHQFYSNLETGEVGVVSIKDLLWENPQLEESRIIHHLDDLKSILQFNSRDGKVELDEFQLVPYQHHQNTVDPDTEVYFIITSGMDGSYIVDNFVSRHELPDFEKWPMTYATLGLILMKSCQHLKLSAETYSEDIILAKKVQDLIKQWKLAIFYVDNLANEHLIENLEESDAIDEMFKIFSSGKNRALDQIINNKGQMRFAMYLNSYGAKILHDSLDDEKIPLNHRISLMKIIIAVTENFLEDISE